MSFFFFVIGAIFFGIKIVYKYGKKLNKYTHITVNLMPIRFVFCSPVGMQTE